MERLQKVMAAAGIGSRRKCEELIAAGRVKVDGIVVKELGTRVGEEAAIHVDGKLLKQERKLYIILNKPAGYVTTLKDTHNRPTIMELVPNKERVYPVGRLDMDTEGLLLLTNDGELTHQLLHPSSQVIKVYKAKITGRILPKTLDQLAKGVPLEDGMTAPARVRLLSGAATSSEVELAIHEGRKHQVKRMLAWFGHKVLKLERTGFGSLTLEGLARGRCRPLKHSEVQELKKAEQISSQKHK
jgi:pseudouridine synthase